MHEPESANSGHGLPQVIEIMGVKLDTILPALGKPNDKKLSKATLKTIILLIMLGPGRAVFVGHGFHATHIYMSALASLMIFDPAGPEDAIVKDTHSICDGGAMRAGLLEMGFRAGHWGR